MTTVGTTSTKRLGSLLALRIWWMELRIPTTDTEGAKGGMWVAGAVEKPNDPVRHGFP